MMIHSAIRPVVIASFLIVLLAWTIPVTAQELATLTASTGGVNHRLGFAVAISGDTVVVGAPSANSDRGAVYIFVKPLGGWTTTATPTATLTNANGAGNDQFGFAVAISGDTIVIGAPTRRVAPHFNRGEVYVFVKPNGSWADSANPTARLTDSNGLGGDQFGFAVDIDGDTIVAGAPSANFNKGLAHIFVKPGGGWITTATPSATLTDVGSAANDQFGFAVAVSGNSAVVGAYGHNIGGKADQGAAYVFDKPGGPWTNTDSPTAKLTVSDPKASDQFGNVVAIDGDNIVVGAWLKDVGTIIDQGAAYLFLKPVGGWTNMTESARLLASDGRNSDTFGAWVDVKGDQVVVGANLDDVGGNRNKGSVYVFVKPDSGWAGMTETAKLNASQGRANDAFGFSTAISGNTVVVGAPNDDLGGNNQQGSALVFDTTALPPAIGAVLPAGEIGALYNASIAISGGTPPFQVSDNGSLPPGLSVNDNGIVTGTPAADAKSTSVTFVVTDQNNATATTTAKMTIVKAVTITTKNLKAGRVGRNYRAPLRAKAGKAPFTWSAEGALPGGLNIDNDIKAITGVPSTATGSPFDVIIKVTDALGGVATKALSITINP